jgi:hypothetical protein
MRGVPPRPGFIRLEPDLLRPDLSQLRAASWELQTGKHGVEAIP